MRKEIGLQNLIIVVLAIAVLAMSVGFATYSANLQINGTATFSKALWDVHFDTGSYNETSTIKSTNHTVGDNSVSYTVTLPSPGSTYSFEINAKNYGTIGAKLKKITMTGLTEQQQKFITYTVNYAGTDYTTTTDNIGTALPAGTSSTAKITVTVSYVYPAEAADLPSADQEVTLSAVFDYVDENVTF